MVKLEMVMVECQTRHGQMSPPIIGVTLSLEFTVLIIGFRHYHEKYLIFATLANQK